MFGKKVVSFEDVFLGALKRIDVTEVYKGNDRHSSVVGDLPLSICRL